LILRYTRQALADLDEARAFITLDRPAAAQAIGERLRSAVEALRMFPERGRPGRVPETRELVVPGTPFIVAYRVAGQEIWILGIIHGARCWPSLF
jgi:toxin ParE1/3/4